MSWFTDIFESPRERAGRSMYGEQTGKYDELINSVLNSRSAYSGIDTMDQAQKTFGLPADVTAIFTPRRQALGTQLGRSRAAMAERLGGRSANPEAAFAPLEGQYANAFSSLESAQAGADLNNRQFNANFLNEIFGKKDAWQQGTFQNRLAAMNGKDNAIARYLQSLSGASTFDDILSAGSTGLGVAGALGWNPLGKG